MPSTVGEEAEGQKAAPLPKVLGSLLPFALGNSGLHPYPRKRVTTFPAFTHPSTQPPVTYKWVSPISRLLLARGSPQDRMGDGDLTCPVGEAVPSSLGSRPLRRCGPNPPGLVIRQPLGTRAL